MRTSLWLAAALGSCSTTMAISTIEAVGSKFFTSDGAQFYIKGIAYQLTPDDPLVDAGQCSQDIALMKTLGVNTIRVYHVDPSADHNGCMTAFADAGIYVLVDMDTFSTYIVPADMYWNQTQLYAYAAVMDAFSGYDNLLGLFIGNEIITQPSESIAAPYIKAAIRDMKAYRDSKSYRRVPIGYSAADIAELRPMLQNYLSCGGDVSVNIDFFSLNSYEWCDPSTYTTSGYPNLESEAVGFPVPIFFSETGCNTPGPRLFADQAAIFGPQMVSDWSGAIIYEWIEEANNYGLISYGPAAGAIVQDGFAREGTPIPVLPDFTNLKSQWATLSPTGVSKSAYDAKTVSTRACPASTAGGWLVDGNVALPTLGVVAGASSQPTVTRAKVTTSSTGTFGTAATAAGTGTGTGAASKGSASDTAAGTSTAKGTTTTTAVGSSPSSSSTTTNAVSGSRERAGVATAVVGVMIALTWLL